MRRTTNNSGFVLLLVLLVLVVCGAAMAAAAHRSGQDLLRASAAERELQVRWGALSCRATVLPNVNQLLNDQNAIDSSTTDQSVADKSIVGKPSDPSAVGKPGDLSAVGKPVVLEIRQSLMLGGLKFNLIAGDESAKANVNMLDDRLGDDMLMRVVTRLQDDAKVVLPITLRPDEIPPQTAAEKAQNGQIPNQPGGSSALTGGATAGGALTGGGTTAQPGGGASQMGDTTTQPADQGPKANAWPMRFVNVDQVLELKGPTELIGSSNQEGSPLARRITCWGNGRLNLSRAEIPTMREVLTGIFDETSLVSLDEYRRKEKNLTLDAIFRFLNLTSAQVDQARPLTGDRSSCYSLWVLVEGPTRNWCYLYTLDTEETQSPDAAPGAAPAGAALGLTFSW